jgi:tRNA (cytidine32/uridine32-2'-O)-methyltransferase
VPICIVLVDPKHPGNIGATARAMKNMGLIDLRLVRPEQFPSIEAASRASGAEDVLNAARVFGEFTDAIADCGMVVGTSARPRYLHWDVLEPRACAAKVVAAARTDSVAVVFGAERMGLTNVELAHCQVLMTIPTNPDYSSLNLAMAVQVVAYEIWLAMRAAPPAEAAREVPLATSEEMERLYSHIEQVLDEIDFRDRTGGGHLMSRIRRLFNRAELDQNEMNILRGILTAVQSRRRHAGERSSS